MYLGSRTPLLVLEIGNHSRSEVKSLSRVQLFVTPWTYQAPLSMGFSRQEYWRRLPFPSPGDLPDLHDSNNNDPLHDQGLSIISIIKI